MTTTLRTGWPVARKEHPCSWCGQAIAEGEKHSVWTGLFEGEFQTNRMHSECYGAWSKLDSLDQEDGYEYGGHNRGSLCERGCRCAQCVEADRVSDS